MKKYLKHWNNVSDKFWEIEVTGSSYTTLQGKAGTVGDPTTRVFNNERECLREAERLVEEQKRKGYVESHSGFINRYELPAVLKQYLQEKRIISTPAGAFTLAAAADIKIISVIVDHRQPVECRDSTIPSGNPYRDDQGLFCGTAYALVSYSTTKRDADGILIWLPLLDLYGSWDPGRRRLYVFPNVTWNDIEKDLSRFLIGSWENSEFPDSLCYLKIWEYFDFIPVDLSTRLENILSTVNETRRTKTIEFLSHYEHRLLRHPFSTPLEDAYKALVKSYHFLGQSFEEEAQYAKAVEWFERSLLIVDQSPLFHNKFYADIFLQLSFCFLEMSSFDQSLYYINIFQAYDPTSADACAQIRSSISRVKELYHDAMESYEKAMETGSDDYYADAIRVTRQALELAPNDPVLHFNLACFYSIKHHVKEALFHLEQALKKGFKDREKIYHDEDLENIRNTREFGEMVVKYFRR